MTTYPTTLTRDQIIVDSGRQRQDWTDVDIPELAERLCEVGMIEPIVLELRSDNLYHLVAGECRIRACDLLGYQTFYHGFSCQVGQPGFVCLEEVDPTTRAELEFQENNERNNLKWWEECAAIAKIHLGRKHTVNEEDQILWAQRHTGKLLGVGEVSVQYAVRLNEFILGKDEEILAATSARDAMNILAKRNEKISEGVAMKLATAKLTQTHTRPEPALGDLGELLPPVVTIQVPLRCHNAKFEHWVLTQPDGSFNHIITDPPYAIDMEYIEQAGMGMAIGEVARTHNIVDNLLDMQKWIQQSYRLLDKNGFCVFWTDQMTWQHIYDLAVLEGFAVQRWPLIWHKTSPCQNGSAQYNFTKKTEIAMVMRKKNATLANTLKSTDNVWTGSASVEQATFGHPFAKPLALHKWVFDAICLKGQTVLDPFAGRGTLATAAIEWGLTPTSVELEGDLHFNHLCNNVSKAYTKLLGPNVQFTQ